MTTEKIIADLRAYQAWRAGIEAQEYPPELGKTIDAAILALIGADNARNQALEEAAKICDFGVKWTPVLAQQNIIDESTDRLAAKIRALKSAAPVVAHPDDIAVDRFVPQP